MDPWASLLNSLTLQQDFFWFLALLAWLGLAIVARRAFPGSAARVPGWMLAVAIIQMFAAVMALLLIVSPRTSGERPQDDVALVVPLALTIGALSWGAWGRRGRLLAGAALIFLVFFRYFGPEWLVTRNGDGVTRNQYLFDQAPLWSATLLAFLNCAAGWRLARAAGPDRRARSWQIGLALMMALPLVSPVGPVASLIHETQMWNRLPRLGLPCALVTMSAGLAGLWSFLAPRATGEWRQFTAGLGCWLLLGFGFTALSGWLARQTFERSLLGQARMGAVLIDPREMASCLVPEFRLGPLLTSDMPDGSRYPYAEAPFLTTPRLAALRAALGVVRRATESATGTHLITCRDGYVVSFAFDDGQTRRNRFVPIHHAIGREDLLAWADRRESAGPVFLWRQNISARVPILGPGRRMLGWLAVDMPLDPWIAAQAQARFQSLLLTGAGVVLGALGFGLRARERARSAAVQAARMQAVFLAKVSHELRTPVQNILGYAQLLRPDDGETRERIEAVQSQGRLLIRLVNDLIDLSAAQTGAFRLQPRAGRLLPTIRESVDAMRPRAVAKGLALEVDLACPDAGLVLCDPERLRQVVTNLVGNAIKFTPAGWVRVALAPIASAGDEQTYQLVVSDSGPGIAPAEQAALFRPFERLKAGGETEGSGLGLALTRMICTAMRGTLDVASDGRQGTTFIAKFMVTSLPAPLSAGTPPALAVVLPASCRVLIADDNTLVRQLLRAWLEAAGAAVAEATNGWEAYRQVGEVEPTVLLADLSMPGLDGVGLARRLRGDGHGPETLRIIGLSAHAGATERAEALAAGMDVFLLKPIEAPELLAAIAGLLRARPEKPPSSGAESLADLRASLRRTFAKEAPAQLRALERAAAKRDFATLAKLAHEFGNAAFALQDAALREASGALEQAAREDRPWIGDLPERVAAAVRALLAEPFAPVSPTGAKSKP